MITSVEELCSQLRQCTPGQYASVVKKVKIRPSGIKPYIRISEGEYTRNCLDRTDSYELVLICWDTGASTPIHDHAGQRCWVYHVEGHINEKRYRQGPEGLQVIEKSTLTPGTLSYMDDQMGFHLLENAGPGRSCTLHLYVSPIDECQVYDPEKEQFEATDLDYDSVRSRGVVAEHP